MSPTLPMRYFLSFFKSYLILVAYSQSPYNVVSSY